MDNVIAIARTTYARHAASKGMWLLLTLMILIIATTIQYGVLTIGREKILTVDLSLAMLTLLGAASVLVLSYDIPRELRQKIAENILSKPLGRDQYLLGKFLGSVLFALRNVLVVAVGMAVVILISQKTLTVDILPPLVGIAGMVIILAAAAALFGSFLSEVPAVIATFLVFWLGHSTFAIVKALPNEAGRLIYGLLPNLHLMNTSMQTSQALFTDQPAVGWPYAGLSLLYAAMYAMALFALGLLIFRKRDI